MVNLVSLTKPTIEELSNAEELIAYCARVSNPTNQLNNVTADKLLAYCAKHAHWSIFEMADMCVEIKTTRDIGRQILRHKSFQFQEFSQRYSIVTDAMFKTRECRLQDITNRQNSLETDDDELKEWFYEAQRQVKYLTSSFYKDALDKGIAKEQARCFLPEGLTMSRMYMKGSIRSWIHYIQLRTGSETQKEHRQIALGCKDILLKEFPSLYFLFDKAS